MVTSFNEAYDEINAFSIKEETTLDETQVVRDLWELEVKSLTVAEPNTKCGEVILENNQKFTLICSLCTNQYDDLELFGRHVIDQHLETTLNLEYKPLENLYVNELFQGPIYSQTLENESCQDTVYCSPQPDLSLNNSSSMHEADAGNDNIAFPSSEVTDNKPQNDEVAEEDMKRYVVKSTNKEIFACTICGCAYSHRRSYLAHARKRHGLLTKRMKEKLLQTAVQEPKTGEDVATDSGEIQALPQQEEFQCEHCPRSYRYKRSLLAHIRTTHCEGSVTQFPPSAKPAESDNTEIIQQPINISFSSEFISQASEYASQNVIYATDENIVDTFPTPESSVESYAAESSVETYAPENSVGTYAPENSAQAYAPGNGIETYAPENSIETYAPENSIENFAPENSMETYPTESSGTYAPENNMEISLIPENIVETSFMPENIFETTSIPENHDKPQKTKRRYKCPHCPKRFTLTDNLNQHKKTHENVIQYSCKFCEKSFMKLNDKNSHEMRYHLGERPFQCEDCGLRFLTRSRLARHIKRHQNIRQYKCDRCEKAFFEAYTLNAHMIVHSGEKPFRCNVCERSFPRKKALRQHERLHSDEKRYVCQTCNEGFAQFAHFLVHKRSHKVLK